LFSRGFFVEGRKMQKIGFIGAGKVGTALAVLLTRKGYMVAAIYDDTLSAAARLHALVNNCTIANNSQQVADIVDLIFITTPDGVIEQVASQIKWAQGKSVVHCSGADSTAILEKARQDGATVGVFHPLQTFAGITQAIENIPGTTFAIEAAEPLLTTLTDMAASLGGNWIQLKAEDKAAYHAAAVFASNYLVTLVKMATDLWQTFEIPLDQAVKALLPLIRGTLHNIETIGLPQCLTGPIARGDIGTIRKHLIEIRIKTPEILPVYKELGLQTIPIALAKGNISNQQARDMEMLLKTFDKKVQGECHENDAEKQNPPGEGNRRQHQLRGQHNHRQQTDEGSGYRRVRASTRS
jgi:predicted short-subunit dehydrogenase-like oxidoreductase (DUF2520 family)